MQFRAKASTTVEAVQWKGDNLTEIQTFMYPSSPLYNAERTESKPIIGVYVWTGAQYTFYELKFPNVGDWIVKTLNGFRLMQKEEFEASYEAAIQVKHTILCHLDHDALLRELEAKDLSGRCPECDAIIRVVAQPFHEPFEFPK